MDCDDNKKNKLKNKFKNKKKSNINYCYAVKEGIKPGIYFSWDDCKDQIFNYKSAVYKKFSKKEDALKYLNGEIDESDLKLTQEETSVLSINDLTFVDSVKDDKTLLDLTKVNKYNNNYYIFTDGSSKTQNYRIVTSGLGIYFGQALINISESYKDKTNNYCELNAIKYVMQIFDLYKSELKKIQKENGDVYFYIVCDSKYSMDSVNCWMDTWQKNGWKIKSGEEVKNKDIFKEIFLLKTKLKLHKINYKIIHVNSHQPPPLSNPYEMFLWKGNQYADYLACYEI